MGAIGDRYGQGARPSKMDPLADVTKNRGGSSCQRQCAALVPIGSGRSQGLWKVNTFSGTMDRSAQLVITAARLAKRRLVFVVGSGIFKFEGSFENI